MGPSVVSCHADVQTTKAEEAAQWKSGQGIAETSKLTTYKTRIMGARVLNLWVANPGKNNVRNNMGMQLHWAIFLCKIKTLKSFLVWGPLLVRLHLLGGILWLSARLLLDISDRCHCRRAVVQLWCTNCKTDILSWRIANTLEGEYLHIQYDLRW